MDINSLIIPLGASILIGALMGLEREKTRITSKGLSAVGIRTDILIGLFGAISALLGQTVGMWIFACCLVAMLILSISSYIYLSIKHDRVGVTTEIATILLFLYGAMTVSGYTQLALILAILTTLVLSLRRPLHNAIYNINDRELYDTLKFALITFVILPLLPNHSYDHEIFNFLFPNQTPPPGFDSINVLNPYNIWFLVVLVSGISFLGYILVKVFGKGRGIAFAGLLGGLYSSSATSLTLAEKSKENPKVIKPYIAGIVLACAASFIRTFIQIRVLSEETFVRILSPIGLMFLYMLIVGLLFMSRSKNNSKTAPINKFETPFKVSQAIKLVLTYTNVEWFMLLSGMLAFFAIDDPIIISTAASAGTLISFDNAKNIIMMVIFLNMIQKVAVAYLFGNRKLVKPLAITFAGLLLVTLAGIFYF
jgi:uncharacterized membrane protein (DUF4010 family)